MFVHRQWKKEKSRLNYFQLNHMVKIDTYVKTGSIPKQQHSENKQHISILLFKDKKA